MPSGRLGPFLAPFDYLPPLSTVCVMLDVTESIERAQRFMDTPEVLTHPLSWWSNGDRGNWHADRHCEKFDPGRSVRQRGSILEGQGRICRACFSRALASLGAVRQWSAAQHAARLTDLLHEVEIALSDDPTSGQAVLSRVQLDSLLEQITRYNDSPSLHIQAFEALTKDVEAEYTRIALILEDAPIQSVRWAATEVIHYSHDWVTDDAYAVLGVSEASTRVLLDAFSGYSRELLVSGSVPKANDAAKATAMTAALTDLTQLRNVPLGRLEGSDLLSAAESLWREFAWSLLLERLHSWSLVYRRGMKLTDSCLVGVTTLPRLWTVPPMALAAADLYRVKSPGSRAPIVLMCPEVVATALSLGAPVWGWDPVQVAGPCDSLAVAETASALWEPWDTGAYQDLASAFAAAQKLA